MFFAPKAFNLRTQWRSHWMGRAAIAADLIADHVPSGHVADLGCGDQKLRKALSDYPFTYQGYDIIAQADDVIPIDLTSDPFPECDVSVLLGVLEYIPIAETLAKVRSPVLVVSHLDRDSGAFSPSLIKSKGWLNVLSKSEFEAELGKSGFRISGCAAADRQHVWIAELVRNTEQAHPARGDIAGSEHEPERVHVGSA